jgi:hypothetical protein
MNWIMLVDSLQSFCTVYDIHIPRYENVWGRGGIAAPFLTSVLDWGGQLHAPAAYLPGKVPLLPIV